MDREEECHQSSGYLPHCLRPGSYTVAKTQYLGSTLIQPWLHFDGEVLAHCYNPRLIWILTVD